MGPCKSCLGNGTTGNPCEACGAGLGVHAGPVAPAVEPAVVAVETTSTTYPVAVEVAEADEPEETNEAEETEASAPEED